MNIWNKWTQISLVKRILVGLVVGAILGMVIPSMTVIGILGETWYHVWYPDTGLSGWMKQDDLWPGNG